MIGCALVLLGHEPDAVVAHLDRIHTIRGKGGWPESAWQAETVRNFAAGRSSRYEASVIRSTPGAYGDRGAEPKKRALPNV